MTRHVMYDSLKTCAIAISKGARFSTQNVLETFAGWALYPDPMGELKALPNSLAGCGGGNLPGRDTKGKRERA